MGNIIEIVDYREFLTQNELPTEYVFSSYAPHLDFPHAMSSSGYGTQIVPSRSLHRVRNSGIPIIFAMRQEPVFACCNYESNTLACLATLLFSMFGETTQEFIIRQCIHAVWVGSELNCRPVRPEDGISYEKVRTIVSAKNIPCRYVFQSKKDAAYHPGRHNALYLYEKV